MYKIIVNLSILSPLVGIIIGLIRRAYKFPKFSIIVILLAVSFLADILSKIAAINFHNSMPVLHLYGFVEVLLVLIYFKRITSHFVFYYFLIYLFSIIYIGNTFLFEPITTFNTIGQAIKCITVILAVVYYYYQLFYHPINDSNKKSFFYISFGILLYYSVSFYSYLLFDLILSNEIKTSFNVWSIHNILNISKNLLLAVGLWNIQPKGKN